MKKTKKEILENINKEVSNSKFIANNTLEINYKDGSKAIRLHNTDVITFKKNGSFILNSGGWRTHTTKERINDFLPNSLTLWQSNSIWYIGESYNKDNSFLFFDGIRFNKDGVIIGKPKKDISDKVNRVKKQIKKFVNGIDKLDKLPLPDSGDCWYCLMHTTEDNIPLGDKINNNDHLKQHIKEGYIHGSLIVNALKESGYRDEGIGLILHMNNKDSVKRSLTKYLQKRLLSEVF